MAFAFCQSLDDIAECGQTFVDHLRLSQRLTRGTGLTHLNEHAGQQQRVRYTYTPQLPYDSAQYHLRACQIHQEQLAVLHGLCRHIALADSDDEHAVAA